MPILAWLHYADPALAPYGRSLTSIAQVLILTHDGPPIDRSFQVPDTANARVFPPHERSGPTRRSSLPPPISSIAADALLRRTAGGAGELRCALSRRIASITTQN